MIIEIRFQNGSVHLVGTLSRPDLPGPNPVVIAAHTSAAGTRDFPVYRHLASTLMEAGISVFLFDRRGSGESTGVFETASFFDLSSDIQAAIDVLRSHPEVDAQRMGLWGMSQGGWIAPLAASRSTDISLVIAVSAAGVSPAKQMNYSAEYALRENGFSDVAVAAMLELRQLIDDYYRGKAKRYRVEMAVHAAHQEEWFPLAYLRDSLPLDPSATKWYQEMDFDPIPVMERLKMPVLLLFGERDPWIPISESISSWREYCPEDLTIQRIISANHFMMPIHKVGLRGDTGYPVVAYACALTEWLKLQFF
jgi:pimeloyl-ACP methyl ester carboxylesterase